MSNVSEWSIAAASNTSASPDGFPEGMAPSGLNDAAREVMAALARWYQDTNGTLITAGTGNAYALTSNAAHAALADQSFLVFQVDRANTGAATLNVDGLGAKSLRIGGEALASGTLIADSVVIAVYNSTADAYDIIGGIQLGANSTVDHSAVSITAGNGLTGGGDLTASRSLAVGAGTGITVGTASVSLDATHDRNVDHGTVSILAGSGLTGGGTIDSSRTLNVGAGNGITVNANDVAMSGSYTGTFTASGDVRAGSDIKVKERLRKIEDAFMVLEGITGYRYWRTDLECDQAGVIAQEVQLALPEAVERDDKNDMLTVAYNQIIPVLVEAVKELKERVDGLAK